MLDAVMLVLREVLEAALFVSLLLALGARLGVPSRWAMSAIPLGLLASWLLGHFAAPISEAFDGTGQELTNAALYLLAIGSFVTLNVLIAPVVVDRRNRAPDQPRLLSVLFVLIVAGSIAREGSEVWIYLSSFVDAPTAMSAAVMGGLIGTGIGLSVCALVYYALFFLGTRTFFVVFFVLATLVVGGLSMQVAKLGLQIGWLDSGAPIWDTTWLVSERAWFGQLLHALFGYDANPNALQAVFYVGALLAVGIGAGVRVARQRGVQAHA
jgi:high-affinity iron transporter